MSLLDEFDLQKRYSEMLTVIRSVNKIWKHIPESDQLRLQELSHDLVDTWEKLEGAYLTHNEDEFEFVVSLYLSIFDDYKILATWHTIKSPTVRFPL